MLRWILLCALSSMMCSPVFGQANVYNQLTRTAAETTDSADVWIPIWDQQATPRKSFKISVAELFKEPKAVVITSGTLTDSAPAMDITQTWNDGTEAFTGWKLNVTDTASAAGSKLLDLQVAGSSKTSIAKNGAIVSTGPLTATVLTASSGQLILSAGGDCVLNRDAAADILALSRNTTPQLFRVYENLSTTTDYSRGVIGFRDSAGVATTSLRIGTEAAGTGTARAVSIVTGGTERINVNTSGVSVFSSTNNTTTIGGSYAINTDAANAFRADAAGFAVLSAYDGVALGSARKVSWASNTDWFGGSLDLSITRSAANILGITNGSTGPGKLAIDNVQGANLERLKMEWASNVARIGTEKAGSGTSRDFAIITNDTERVKVRGDAGSVSITGGTITTSSKPTIDATQTWNDAAVTFTGFKQNITDTASGVNSLLFDWQSGGVSFLKLTKFGDLVGSAFTGTDFSIRMQNGSLKQGSSTITAWGSSNAAGTMDTALARGGAGIVKFTNASTGAGMIQLQEAGAAPSAPAADNVIIYAIDNGSGKTQLMALFSSGAAQEIAIQP